MDDLIESYEWEFDRVDWSDSSLDANDISRILIGSCRHWKDENRDPADVGLSPLEHEILILREAGWKNWGGTSRVGKPYFRHMLALIKLMMPKTDIHPNLADSVKLFCLSLAAGRKGMNMLGSQNSSKSSSSVRISFAVMAIFPEEAAIYYANPFDSAADSTIWGEVEECYEEVMEAQPGLFPDSVKYALKRLELVPGVPKAGTMEIRNVKAVGKMKGTKTRKTGDVQGLILTVIDEVNEIYNHAFISMLSNLASQDGFYSMTSQNFKDPLDMGGRLANPSAHYGGPGSYKELGKDTDHIWDSYGRTVTIRFNGKRSPNIVANRSIYSYLFTKENHQHLIETYGENSPEYYSQCLSFPLEGDEANMVLTKSRINSSRHDDPFFTITGDHIKVSFCDPSFGGGDKAMYGWASFGEIKYNDSEGGVHKMRAMVFHEPMSRLTIDKTMVVDQRIKERLESVGINSGDFIIGDKFDPEPQIALQCRERNVRLEIPDSHFGYDFSMRPDIVVWMSKIAGGNTVPFDYNTKPQGYMIESLKMNSEDACRMRSDELAFLSSDVFAMKAIRGGNMIPAAILQLGRTRYETRNGKRIIDKKADFKARWNNESPDDRDTLMGCIGMAYRHGFSISRVPDLKDPRLARSRSGAHLLTKSGGGDIREVKFRRRKGTRIKL